MPLKHNFYHLSQLPQVVTLGVLVFHGLLHLIQKQKSHFKNLYLKKIPCESYLNILCIIHSNLSCEFLMIE